MKAVITLLDGAEHTIEAHSLLGLFQAYHQLIDRESISDQEIASARMAETKSFELANLEEG